MQTTYVSWLPVQGTCFFWSAHGGDLHASSLTRGSLLLSFSSLSLPHNSNFPATTSANESACLGSFVSVASSSVHWSNNALALFPFVIDFIAPNQLSLNLDRRLGEDKARCTDVYWFVDCRCRLQPIEDVMSCQWTPRYAVRVGFVWRGRLAYGSMRSCGRFLSCFAVSALLVLCCWCCATLLGLSVNSITTSWT